MTDRGLNNTNRVCARDDAQGPANAMFAVQDLKAKKIAVFDDGTTGPKGAADEFEKKAKALGAQVLRYQVRAGDKDFRAILGTVPKDVQLILASVWAPEAALIAKQLARRGSRREDDRQRRPVRAEGLHRSIGRCGRRQLRDLPGARHEEGSRRRQAS